jgi:hypothetical protein
VVDGCILANRHAGNSNALAVKLESNPTVRNTVVFARGVSGVALGWNGATLSYVTVFNDGAGSGQGIKCDAGSPVLKNCCVIGFASNSFSGTFGGSSSNNATDHSSAPGTSALTSITPSAAFIDASTSTPDLKLAVASPLIAAGVTVSGITTDILSQTRPATPSIGALDVAAASNAAPVVTTTGSTLAYTEGDGAVVIDSGITVTDADNANLTSATVAITANYASGQDVLAFSNQLGITGSWNSGAGVLTLSGTTTVENYQTALRAVTFANAAPTSGTRVVTFTANDGTATGSATRSIAVTGANVIAATVGNAVAAGSQAQILTALAGRITTKALRYPNTALRASVAVTLRVSHPTTGAHVVDVAATTNASGIAEIYSAALTAGASYAVEVIETSTGFRRLPVVVATA